MKMLLLDVFENELKVVDANGLEDYYKFIRCDCIDIVRRKIGDVEVEIVCDDEGLLIDKPKVSAIDVDGTPALFGNLLVAGGKVIDGELTELTVEEAFEIMNNVAEVTTSVYKEPFRVFVEMDYC